MIQYDEFILYVGDSLMDKINFGLKNSNFGIVIFSKNFFKKRWAKKELDGLNSKATKGTRKVILPVWHKITYQYLSDRYPMFAGLLAVSAKFGIDNVAEKLEKAINHERNEAAKIIENKSSSNKREVLQSPQYNDGYRAGAIRAQKDVDAFENHKISQLSGSEAPPCPMPTKIEYCKGWENGYTDQVSYQMEQAIS